VNGFQTVNGTPTVTELAAPDTQETQPISAASIVQAPEAGTYSGPCTFYYGATSCFGIYFPPATINGYVSFTVTAGSSVSQDISYIAEYVSGPTGEGCSIESPAVTVTSTSIAASGSCTVPAGNGCTSQTMINTCTATLQ
jgi:hypothetical protein